MSRSSSFIDDDAAFRRLVVILVGLIVVVALGSGGFYYWTHFQSTQAPLMELGRENLENVVLKDPESIDARMNVAMVYYRGGRLEDAIAQFKEVLKMKADFEPAQIGIGVAYAQKKQPDDAIPVLEKIVAAHQNDEMFMQDRQMQAVVYELGLMYTLKNDLDNAEKTLKLAYQANRSDADTVYALSEVYRLQGKYDDAIAGYSIATSYVPDFKEAYQGLSAAFDAQGLKPQKLYADGMVQYSAQNYDAAISLLQQSAAADATYPAVHFGLGLAYAKKGDKEKGIAAFQKALELAPDDKMVKDRLNQLQSMP